MKGATAKSLTSIVFSMLVWESYVVSISFLLMWIAKTFLFIGSHLFLVILDAARALKSDLHSFEMLIKSLENLLNQTAALNYSINPMELGGVATAGVFSGLLLMLICNVFFSLKPLKRSLMMVAKGAQPIFSHELTEFANTLNHNAKLAGVYIIPMQQLNAFAISRFKGRGIIVVTTRVLEECDKEELRFLLSHELGHIENGDASANLTVLSSLYVYFILDLVCSIATNLLIKIFSIFRLVRFIAFIPIILVTVLLAGLRLITKIARSLFRLLDACFSRSIEYQADARGAELSNKEAGISLLSKIGDRPFSLVPNLLATHPRTSKRIKRLNSIKP